MHVVLDWRLRGLLSVAQKSSALLFGCRFDAAWLAGVLANWGLC